MTGKTKPEDATATKLKRIAERYDISLCEWFCRQPIALIGHDGLESGGSRSDPASLPNNKSG